MARKKGSLGLKQNIGLILLTSGSIILGISVFRVCLVKFYQIEWMQIPWEVKLFCRFIGISGRDDYFKKLVLGKKEYVLPDEELRLADRIKVDLPIIALFLMIVGMFFCMDYSAFCSWL